MLTGEEPSGKQPELSPLPVSPEYPRDMARADLVVMNSSCFFHSKSQFSLLPDYFPFQRGYNSCQGSGSPRTHAPPSDVQAGGCSSAAGSELAFGQKWRPARPESESCLSVHIYIRQR